MIISVLSIGIVSGQAADLNETLIAIQQCADKPSDIDELISMYTAAYNSTESTWSVTGWMLHNLFVAVDQDGNPMNAYGRVVLDAYELPRKEFYVDTPHG